MRLRKWRWAVIPVQILAMIPMFALGGAVETGEEVIRIFGGDRYETAAAVCSAGWEHSSVVFLARGDDFADALAAVPLAHKYDAPVLLTMGRELPDASRMEIQRLGARQVVILGGPGAISDDVERELVEMDLDVQRLYGQDRFETAAIVAELVAPEPWGVFLVSGRDYPDALAAAPQAARLGYPILLTGDEMPTVTREALAKAGEVIVVGGPAAVDDKQLAGLPVLRLGGMDRYHTALAVAEHFGTQGGGLIASGRAFPDAVTGGALAARWGRGILLADIELHEEVAETIHKSGVSSAVVLGGPAAVSPSVIRDLERIISGEYLDLISAVVRSNTQVVALLAEAPLRQLTPADFKISPALAIDSVTTNDNVVVLSTAPQEAGAEYTLHPEFGMGKALFFGKEALGQHEFTADIDMVNLRQLSFQFSKPVAWADARLLDNYYLDLTGDYLGDLAGRSLQSILGDGWEVWTDQEGDFVDGVIVQSVDGALLTEALNLPLGSTAVINLRNIRAATGGYIHTIGSEIMLDDSVSPAIEDVHIRGEEMTIIFSEPLQRGYASGQDFAIYVNGYAFKEADLSPGGNILSNGSVDQGRTLHFKLPVSAETYEIIVVGAKDLAGNMQSPNPWRGSIDEKDEVSEPPVLKRPQVIGLHQRADNVLEILFDSPNVVPLTQGPAITIRSAVQHGGSRADLEISSGSIDMTQVWDDGLSKWVVAYPAVLSGDDPGAFNYLGQYQVTRDVVVDNYTVQGNPPGLEGKKTVSEVTFAYDRVSPVVQGISYDHQFGRLYVGFYDGPFDGIIEPGTGWVRVSRTTPQGVTHSQYLQIGGSDAYVPDFPGGCYEAGKYLQLSLSGNLTDSEGGLLYETVYTVELPWGAVQEANRRNVAGDADEINVGPQNMSSASAHSVVTSAEPGPPEGRVPQTTPGLVQSGRDMALAGATAVTWAGSPAQVGSIEFMTRAENHNKVIVVFDGEVDEAAAVNKKNFCLNGQPLPADAKLTYYNQGGLNANIIGVDGVLGGSVGFTLITLPPGTVPVTGAYLLTVENVTNYAGKRMIPVTTAVGLVKNTPPQAVGARIIGSRQVEISFDGPVRVTDSRARENFLVQADGGWFGVNSVDLVGGNRVFLNLGRNLLPNSSLIVEVVGDHNGFMWITDLEGNPLARGVMENR
jgi:putative cell wall-binding protein